MGQRVPQQIRRPAQDRSRSTVDAILEASVQLLLGPGGDSLSTKGVAARAGVSIGTLYQYFPNKEALLLALSERQSEAIVGASLDLLQQSEALTLEELARQLIAGLLAVYQANAPLQRALATHDVLSHHLRLSEVATNRVEQAIRVKLAAWPRHPERLELAVFLITRAVPAAAWSAVRERPELAASDALVDELTRMVTGYLEATLPAGG